ncbi:MAG: hypothetical protein ACI87N_003657 [Flavobacteriales bacterium]|jgi:hypothetical protein
MNKFKKLNLFLGVVLLSAIFSCTDEPNLQETASQSKNEDWIKLGKKLENPYSIKNMKLALQNLKAKNAKLTSKELSIDPGFDIVPNYLYVEFQPQTEAEEAVLKQDSSVVLLDYPLDYEFTDEVLDSRPALIGNQVPNYYSAIKIDSETASEAHYETLEQLYIPEEDPYFGSNLSSKQKVSDKKEILLDKLLDEAFKLTGNKRVDSQPKTSVTARWIFGTRWWPSGNISIYDEVAGANKPVVGAQVLIRQWFTVRQGITDANGNFSTSSVRGSARYIIQWERYNYSIRNGSFFQAELRGPVKKEESWNYTINNGQGDSDDKYHALIHQTAHDYYYGHRFGLISPPKNNHFYSFGLQRQIKIAAREISNGNYTGSYSHLKGDLSNGIIAQISIRKWDSPSDEIYGTTIHELAHAAHSVLDRGSYDNLVRDAWIIPWQGGAVVNNNRRTLETWARTVETVMTLDRYKTKFSISNYSLYKERATNNYQFLTISGDIHYTSAGFDLIDNFNQSLNYGANYPIDRVNGYTINQLEASLVNAKSWWQWRDNIKTNMIITQLNNT